MNSDIKTVSSPIHVLVSESGGVLLRDTRQKCLGYIKTNKVKNSIIHRFDNEDQWRNSYLFNKNTKEPRFLFKDTDGQLYNVSKSTLEALINTRNKTKGKMTPIKKHI